MNNSKKAHLIFGTAEGIEELSAGLRIQLDLLYQARLMVGEQSDEVWHTIYPLIWSVEDSSQSIIILARAGKMRDCMILARGVLETIINISFICVKGKQAAKRAYRHYMQKSVRGIIQDIDFKERYLGEVYSIKFDLNKSPAIKAAVDEYTGRKGREITAWIPESLQAKVDAITKKYGKKLSKPLEVVIDSIYRDSSELIHGTFYGAMFSFGWAKVPKELLSPPVNLKEHYQEHISMVLFLISGAISALIKILSRELPLKQISDKSRKLYIKSGHKFFPDLAKT
jgi:hypothetical protein